MSNLHGPGVDWVGAGAPSPISPGRRRAQRRTAAAGTLVFMATTEDRLAAVEQQAQEDRHAIRAGLEGVSHGVLLTYADTQAIRADVGELRRDVGILRRDVDDLRTAVGSLGEKVGGMDERLGRVESDVSEIKTTLAEVLRRLPEPPA